MKDKAAYQPLVSIALTTYNGEQYLPALLDSLLAQTYPNIEIIATDDISQDGTLILLQRYERLYSHIKVYVNETNLGYIKNFEKTMGLCNGDYIAPCDQDDCWLPDKIKRSVEAIGDYPMVYCDSLVANEKLQPTGRKISDAVVCRTFTNCLNYAVFANVYGHASLFKRSLYTGASDFPLYMPYDWWLCFQATLQGGVTFLPEALILYRQHSNNLFGVIGKKKKEHNKQKKSKERADQRGRIALFYEQCPDSLVKEKKVLYKLKKSYADFSFANNILRMTTFFANYKTLLAVKKRNTMRKLLFCCKMFIKLK